MPRSRLNIESYFYTPKVYRTTKDCNLTGQNITFLNDTQKYRTFTQQKYKTFVVLQPYFLHSSQQDLKGEFHSKST
jgi:hypothetical protein